MSEFDKSYQNDEIQIDILDLIRDLMKDWWLIILMGLTAAMFTYIITNLTYKPSYTSSTTLVVTSKGSNDTYSNLSAASTVASSLTEIFGSTVLKKKVAMDIGSVKVPGAITAEVIPETNLLVLMVSSSDPYSAYKVINSVMKNYSSVTNHIYGNAILDVMEAPRIPVYPDNPMEAVQNMKIAFLIGMAVMTVILAYFSIIRDDIKNEREITKKLDTKLFGVIYHENKYKTLRSLMRRKKKGLLITNPTVSFEFVENFKKMRTKLEYKLSQQCCKVILITSVMENEGKSTVAANLALSLVQKYKFVLFIDADLSNPSVFKLLQKDVKKENEIGECIKNNGNLQDALTYDENTGLYLVIGSKNYGNSTDLIVRDSFREFFNVSRSMMDYIIIDAPPVSVAADTEILADIADASLLVVKQSTARTQDINDTIDILSNYNAELLGCVYNNVRTNLLGRRSGYGHKYSYEGHYYRSTDNKAVDRV